MPYLDSQIALCVYDITKKESFPVLKGWVDELRAKGPENICILGFIQCWQWSEIKLILLRRRKLVITRPRIMRKRTGQCLNLPVPRMERGLMYFSLKIGTLHSYGIEIR